MTFSMETYKFKNNFRSFVIDFETSIKCTQRVREVYESWVAINFRRNERLKNLHVYGEIPYTYNSL